jgi:hypothetical protein
MEETMRNLAFLSLAMLAACPADTDKTTGDTGTTDTSDTTDTEPTTTPPFDINGVALSLAAPTGAGLAGVCVVLIDPSPALQGKPAEVIAGPVTTDANGAFSFEAVVPPSALGLLMGVNDCNEEPVDCAEGVTDSLFSANTGIQGSSFPTDGSTLEQPAFAVDCATLAGFEASAPATGYTGDLSTDGFMVGFVWDPTPLPIGGATVTCDACGDITTMYADTDAANFGLFAQDEVANVATSPASGLFVIPGAPISSYTATAAGYTFADQLNGSNPGSAVVTVMFGTAAP